MIKSILIILLLAVIFIVLIRFISKQGGWQGGCGGNCSECGQGCSAEEQKQKKQK